MKFGPTLALPNPMELDSYFEKIKKRAYEVDTTLLILGQSGTGKSRLAKIIHSRSKRRTAPFISINLATLSENLIESELFGHERGAFSGADLKRKGRIECAQGGTLFLDEIGELPPRAQGKLLEFLQNKTLIPVGGNREIKLNVRIITATNKSLLNLIHSKLFREDLYFRLNAFKIKMPPLRGDKKSISNLSFQFLEEFNEDHQCNVNPISEEALQILYTKNWLGNIRELRNTIEFLVVMTKQGNIPTQFILEFFQKSQADLSPCDFPTYEPSQNVFASTDYRTCKEIFERAFLTYLLKMTGGRVNESARRAKISKATLIEKMKRFDLRAENFKKLTQEERTEYAIA